MIDYDRESSIPTVPYQSTFHGVASRAHPHMGNKSVIALIKALLLRQHPWTVGWSSVGLLGGIG
jgi:hypothetical protein